MPIVLNTDPERRHRLEIGDSVIIYTRATGDEVQRAFDSTANPKTGGYDTPAAITQLMERHVCGWENVFDADHQPVPFSEDLVPLFVAGLGYSERLRIDKAITSAYVEGVEGKAVSSSGSSGTD